MNLILDNDEIIRVDLSKYLGGHLDRHVFWNIHEDKLARRYLQELQNGGTAVEAVEKAVRVFEEHDHFNAGRGSCLNESDEVECDAMIMHGWT